MNRILLLLMMLFSLQMYAGTASMDEQEKKPVNIELHKGAPDDSDTNPPEAEIIEDWTNRTEIVE